MNISDLQGISLVIVWRVHWGGGGDKRQFGKKPQEGHLGQAAAAAMHILRKLS